MSYEGGEVRSSATLAGRALEIDAEVAELRLRLASARMRQFRHDLINAFAAVDCAGVLLGREDLTPVERSTLVELLGSGLQGLRALLAADPAEERVALAELMSANSREPGWPDLARVDVAPELMVVGPSGEVAEVVRQVLAHAGSEATVRGARTGDRVELWVAHGHLLGTADRQGSRGLDIARGLARAQGGDIEVQTGPGGGESIGIFWPAAHG